MALINRPVQLASTTDTSPPSVAATAAAAMATEGDMNECVTNKPTLYPVTSQSLRYVFNAFHTYSGKQIYEKTLCKYQSLYIKY